MTRPRTVITERDQTPPRTAPTDTGVWFAVGLADRGPSTAQLVTSMESFEDTFGDRQAYSVLYDCVETFFREGGSKCYIARVMGPTPVKATKTLNDSSAAATMRVDAKSAGEWGNDLDVAITAGDDTGEFKVVISHDTLGTLETSPSLADVTAAVSWSASSDWVDIVDLGTSANDPDVVSAQSLASGTDDRTNITDTQRTAGLDQFTRDLGPGQVSIPGSYSGSVHQALLEHAADNNRVALLDGSDTTSPSTLVSYATAVRALGDSQKHGAFFAPWAEIVGYRGSSTTRVVPYSAVEAGIIARNDALGNPNTPGAGANGRARSVVGLTATFTDAQLDTLNDGGINVARMIYDQPTTYGFRSVADKDDYPLHWQFSWLRTDMQIAAKAEQIAERFLFQIIDGQGHLIAQFNGELASMLRRYFDIDALFGDTPDEAFRVDTGSSVNTTDSIADGRLRAVLSIRRSPFAEQVEVEIVKVAINDTV